MRNVLHEIDWELLREQKETLINLTSSDKLNQDESDNLTGLLYLIDTLQERAIDNGIDETVVYGCLMGNMLKAVKK